jgi:hypothetical protein
MGLSTFVVAPNLVVSHEVWAATLMAMSWGCWGGSRAQTASQDIRAWLPSVLLAAGAVLIRETALPFVLLMGVFAAWHRQWRQVAGWAAVVAVLAVCLAVHANYVQAATVPGDLASVGWTNLAGWPFFVMAMHGATGLRILPEWGGVIVVPLTVLGWISWRSETGMFGALLFAGYALIFMVLGRPDNWYWGLLISPLFLIGLMFVPQAIADLVAVIRGDVNADAPATDKQWPTTSAPPAAVR